MPPKERKKFRRFLAARHHRQRRSAPGAISGRFLAMRAGDVARTLAIPFLALVVYGLLYAVSAFTSVRPWLHGAALALFAVWIALAMRGATGVWFHKTHLRFVLPIVLCVFFGSAWAGWGAPPAKAWVTPPAYAHLPSVQLDDDAESGAPSDGTVLEGSVLHISQPGDAPAAQARFAGQEQELDPMDGGESTVSFVAPETEVEKRLPLLLWRGLHRLALWKVRVAPDQPPRIAFTEEPDLTLRKTVRLAYEASDDYGVVSVSVRLSPTTAAKDASPVEIPLATPGAKQVKTASYADLTSLPWAGQTVTAQLVATDGAGHKGYSAPKTIVLPVRAFRNPFARALIEERQKLLDNPDPTVRDETANVMAGIARQQSLYRGDPVVMLSLRAGAVRLVLNEEAATVPDVSALLWKVAVRLEEGAVGLARAELAASERDLSEALAREADKATTGLLLNRMRVALTAYFDALEAERAAQPPPMQELDWPLAMSGGGLTAEDLQNRLADIGSLLQIGKERDAGEKLAQLQGVIENLRTTPPELTQSQYKLVHQVTTVRALIRSQKLLVEDEAPFVDQKPKSYEAKKKLRDAAARSLAQQHLLLSALKDALGKTEQAADELKGGEQAMRAAVGFLQQNDVTQAHQKQVEALALMENALLALSEQMQKSLAAKEP